MKKTALSKPTKKQSNQELPMNPLLLLVAVIVVLLIVFQAACSPRKIRYPKNVIEACPYTHELIEAGPLTPEKLLSLVKNHDLDHKCINYLKNLLKPFAEKSKQINYTLDSVTPKPHYSIILIDDPAFGLVALSEVAQSWNHALGLSAVSIVDSYFNANVYVKGTDTLPDKTAAVALTAPNKPCVIFIKNNLNYPEPFLETMTHELGHCMGLDHRPDLDQIMQAVDFIGHHVVDEVSARILKDFNPYW